MNDNPVSITELEAALDKLILAENEKKLQPEDITVQIVVRKTKWNARHAKTFIEELQEAGTIVYLGKRRQPDRGAMVDAWRLVKA